MTSIFAGLDKKSSNNTSNFDWEKFEENSLPKAYIYFSLGLSFFAFAATSKPYEEPAPIRHIFQYHNQIVLHRTF